MEKSFTKDGARWFTCRRCGLRNCENIYRWKKKPQPMKNICTLCIKKRNWHTKKLGNEFITVHSNIHFNS